jgi:hypothetical protein
MVGAALSSAAKALLAAELAGAVAEARVNAVEPVEENHWILSEAMHASASPLPHAPAPATVPLPVVRGELPGWVMRNSFLELAG